MNSCDNNNLKQQRMTEQHLKNLGLKDYIMNPNDHAEDQYSLSDLLTDFAREYHTKQLFIYGVVGSKKDVPKTLNILLEMLEAYNYHDKSLKEVKPLGREYFEILGRREGFLNAIEIFTGLEF